MKKICFKDECKERVAFACSCGQYTCAGDLAGHMVSSGRHLSQKSLLIRLDPADLSSELLETQGKLENFIKFITAQTKTLIEKITKESQKLISQIQILELKVAELTKSLLIENIVDVEDLDKVNEILKSTLFENNVLKDDLVEKITEFYNIDNCYKSGTEFLYVIKDDSRSMTLVSCDKPDIIYPQYIWNGFNQYIGHCELPNNKHFFYGGLLITKGLFTPSRNYLNTAYIIDIEKKLAIPQKAGNAKANMACCYYKDNIYVFGGSMGKRLDTAEKYDLKANSWQPLSPLPAPCSDGTCLRLKTKIIYAGLISTSIVVYSIPKNIYDTYGKFETNTHKIISNYQDITYVFEAGKLLRTLGWDFSGFKIVNYNTGVPNDFVVAYGILKDKNFYFVLENKNLYKFDFKTECILYLRKL